MRHTRIIAETCLVPWPSLFSKDSREEIGKQSANVACFREAAEETESRKSLILMEPAPGLEPGTY